MLLPPDRDYKPPLKAPDFSLKPEGTSPPERPPKVRSEDLKERLYRDHLANKEILDKLLEDMVYAFDTFVFLTDDGKRLNGFFSEYKNIREKHYQAKNLMKKLGIYKNIPFHAERP